MRKSRHPCNMAVGLRIRRRREELGMTIEELVAKAEALDVKVKPSTVGHYELGWRGLTVERLAKFAAVLKTSTLALMLDEVEPTYRTPYEAAMAVRA